MSWLAPSVSLVRPPECRLGDQLTMLFRHSHLLPMITRRSSVLCKMVAWIMQSWRLGVHYSQDDWREGVYLCLRELKLQKLVTRIVYNDDDVMILSNFAALKCLIFKILYNAGD